MPPGITQNTAGYGGPNEPFALCKSRDGLSRQSVWFNCRAMPLTLVKTERNKLWEWTGQQTNRFTAS